MGIHSNIFVFDTPDQLAEAAAERFVTEAQGAINSHGAFSVALAGGNTPRRVYQLLATDNFKTRIHWQSVHLFFGDERCVPPDHPDSNYGMIHETLISKIEIPSANVHRIIGEIDAAQGARAYEEELKVFFADRAWPRFDLVLLGMGADGHTASLFPASDALKEKFKWVVATRKEPLEPERITLTVPVFNHAAEVVFLITGKEKATRLGHVLGESSGSDRVPAQEIQPDAGLLEWLVDKAAACNLQPPAALAPGSFLAPDEAKHPEDEYENQDSRDATAAKFPSGGSREKST